MQEFKSWNVLYLTNVKMLLQNCMEKNRARTIETRINIINVHIIIFKTRIYRLVGENTGSQGSRHSFLSTDPVCL